MPTPPALSRLALLVPTVALVAAATIPSRSADATVFMWGEYGHLLTGQIAAEALTPAMPAFFRAASAQLSYLNPEPDRWRDSLERAAEPALGSGSGHDHYVNFERVPAAALAAPDRYGYLAALERAGTPLPGAGFLPYRIVELTQHLRLNFRRWRAAPDSATRRFIEARILNDAGILGHYVADGANPAHTTIHHNGWVGANPDGYATDRRFHSRFETVYVRTHIGLDDLRPLVPATSRDVGPLRPAVLEYLRRSHGELDRLYQLDKRESFSETTQGDDHRRFAAARLAAGAEMLRDLWWTAWVTSAPPAAASGASAAPAPR